MLKLMSKRRDARRRSGVFALFGAASVALSMLAMDCPIAKAQDLPGRPITLIEPFGAGGSSDAITRVLAQELSKRIERPVVIVNKPGASGILGTQAVAQAEPDGSVIGLATTTTVSIVPAINAQLPFNVATDIKPIALFGVGPNVFAIQNDLGPKNLAEFVAASKQHKGEYFYGSGGIGHTYHLLAELLKSETGAEMTHVPYKADPAIIQDMIGGRIQASFLNVMSAVPFINAGKLRALAIAAAHRSKLLPDVPTFSELGIKSMEQSSWYGLIAPGKTPDAIVQRLAHEIEESLKSPDVLTAIERGGAEAAFLGPDAFKSFIANELNKWSGIAKARNIQMN